MRVGGTERPRPIDPAPARGGNPWQGPPGPPRVRRLRFGPWQGLWRLIQFMLVQIGVVTALTLSRGVFVGLVRDVQASLAGRPIPHLVMAPPGAALVAASVIAAYVLAGLWCLRYVLRRARDRLALGTPEGIAWRPADRGGYRAAVALGIGTVAATMAILRLMPIPPGRMAHSDFQALLMPGWMLGPSLVLLLLIAPLTEEFLFRGAAFAAFAARTGPAWATVVVTLLFVAVHAPEKIQYPPGFIDVSLMALGAVWLRLRYRSIRPAILLHVIYNVGVSGAAFLLR